MTAIVRVFLSSTMSGPTGSGNRPLMGVRMATQQDRTAPTEHRTTTSDLAELGYKQELHRRLSGFSQLRRLVLDHLHPGRRITTYGIAMDAGGPVAITIGWLFVGMFVLVALAMAEVCSVYPTAGALYWWAGSWPSANKRAWAWFVGWFNFLGEVAVTAAIDFGAAITRTALLSLAFGLEVTPTSTFVVFVVIIVAARPAQHVRRQPGPAALRRQRLVAPGRCRGHRRRPVARPRPAPAAVLDLLRVPQRDRVRRRSSAAAYAVLIGLLMAQYTYTGYDASAHVAEETHDAAVEAPRGIVTLRLGLGHRRLRPALRVTWSIQDYEGAARHRARAAAGADLHRRRRRRPGQFLLFICVVAQFFCGMASVTANSRMSYAFSRDNALPGSRLWAKVNPRTGTPTNSIWLCVACSILVGCRRCGTPRPTSPRPPSPSSGSTSPTSPRSCCAGRNPDFQAGPWNLGRWSASIGWIAIAWVAVIVVLFMLPAYAPGTWGDATFNYAPLAVGVVLAFSTISWFVGGRKHFMVDVPEGHDTIPPAEIFR